jgi:hypothetical protein
VKLVQYYGGCWSATEDTSLDAYSLEFISEGAYIYSNYRITDTVSVSLRIYKLLRNAFSVQQNL